MYCPSFASRYLRNLNAPYSVYVNVCLCNSTLSVSVHMSQVVQHVAVDFTMDCICTDFQNKVFLLRFCDMPALETVYSQETRSL